MKAMFAMQYEHGTNLRAKALLLAKNWLIAVSKIREIKNKQCVVNDKKFDKITYTSDDLTFQISYDLDARQNILFTISIGDATYVVTIIGISIDHQSDSLFVSGPPSLITVGEDGWYTVVGRCMDKILLYTPGE